MVTTFTYKPSLVRIDARSIIKHADTIVRDRHSHFSAVWPWPLTTLAQNLSQTGCPNITMFAKIGNHKYNRIRIMTEWHTNIPRHRETDSQYHYTCAPFQGEMRMTLSKVHTSTMAGADATKFLLLNTCWLTHPPMCSMAVPHLTINPNPTLTLHVIQIITKI